MLSPVLILEENTQGRDIIIGDLHGMTPVLRTLLGEIDFNGRVDRLISVGDLIDRGAFSEEALDLLDQDWFHCVRGNHEQFLIESMTDEGMRKQWFRNGGHWAENIDKEVLQGYADKLDDLPYLIEFKSGGALVGVVHADLPAGLSWGTLKSRLEQEGCRYDQAGNALNNDHLKEVMLWSRLRINKALEEEVEGVSRVFVGHTIVEKHNTLSNIVYLDTGACVSQRTIGEPEHRLASTVSLTAAIIQDGGILFHSTPSFSSIDVAPYDPATGSSKMGYAW